MALATKLSVEMCGLKTDESSEVISLLKKFELPVTHEVSAEIINNFLIKDKKKNRSFIDFILLTKIGEACIKSIPIDELKERINDLCLKPI
jgi:3-dehydroquinate synthase